MTRKARDLLVLRLYIAGHTPRSIAALANIRRICEEHASGFYEIDVVDLLVDPERAGDDEIVAVPALVKKSPLPQQCIIGDLSNPERVISALGL